jgi:hypothetical protein
VPHAGQVFFDVQVQALLQVIPESQGLGEQKARIKEDDRDIGLHFHGQAQQTGALGAKAAADGDLIAEGVAGSSDDIQGLGGSKAAVERS